MSGEESTPITHLLNDWALMMHRRRLIHQGNIAMVVPLHDCRRAFAAFGCAVMVTLPQAALGVAAAVIDPPRKSCS